MKSALALFAACLGVAGLAHAQTPAAAPGLVVGNGNFFSPVVGDLDKAMQFYHDGLGLEFPAAPSDADANPALRAMFGQPDAHIRWIVGRALPIPGGVEVVEISKVARHPAERAIQDPGAFQLIAVVRDVDTVLARLRRLGAPIVTRGGAPVAVSVGGRNARIVVVKDPGGHYVELVQPEPLPETQAPATADVIGVRVRLTVDDVDRALRLYREALGLELQNQPEWSDNAALRKAFGLSGGEYRVANLAVPGSGLVLELLDFKGVERRTLHAGIQDPGSARIQLRVRDIDAAIAALVRAGGAVVSTGGKTVDLPAGPGNPIKVAVVRDPDNLFLVLIEAPPPAAH